MFFVRELTVKTFLFYAKIDLEWRGNFFFSFLEIEKFLSLFGNTNDETGQD